MTSELSEEIFGVELEAISLLLPGGFPCQDLSVAGERAGLDGARSGLFHELVRCLEYYQPEWFVLENVPGLLSHDNGRTHSTVLSRLEECGYGVAWRTIDAQYCGVAGKRRRVFIVGSLGSTAAFDVLFEPGEELGALQNKEPKGDQKPMCVGWDGGLSFERLRQCVVTKTHPTGAGEGNGVRRRLDRHRYRALGNSIVPEVAYRILSRIVQVNREAYE